MLVQYFTIMLPGCISLIHNHLVPSLIAYLVSSDFHGFSVSLTFRLIFEFKKEGIVVGKVEVMANCRKKPRQIVELSGQPSQGLILSL